ncbi:hypothetical protein LJR234_005987 [Mesorhizobium amorphae]
MKKYVAAAFIGIAIGPASALDTAIGGKVGGVAVGVGASVDGVGGADVGSSVGAGNGSPSGNVSDTSGGLSTGIGVGDDPSAENGSATAPGSPAAVATATAKTASQSIVLPPVLRPSKAGEGGFTKGPPLKAKPGTPAAVVQACRAAIMSAATPLGAVRVHAVSAGALHQRRGTLTAPIEVRIDYARQGVIEGRQARVGCRLDAAGRVTEVI